jgi:hypothetical protein
MNGKSRIVRLSLDDLSCDFCPWSCELREVELQLSVVDTFCQTGTLSSSFQVFVDVFPHHDKLAFRLGMVASFEAEQISLWNWSDWFCSARAKCDTDLARRPRLNTKAQSFQCGSERLSPITGGDGDNKETGTAQEVCQTAEGCFESFHRVFSPSEECHVKLAARNVAEGCGCCA